MSLSPAEQLAETLRGKCQLSPEREALEASSDYFSKFSSIVQDFYVLKTDHLEKADNAEVMARAEMACKLMDVVKDQLKKIFRHMGERAWKTS